MTQIVGNIKSGGLNPGLIKVEYQGSLYTLVTKPPQADAPKEKAKKMIKKNIFENVAC